ncbi:MAG TPA: Bax inhibitor-1/YccA family protein [Flavisolibacter sp.]
MDTQILASPEQIELDQKRFISKVYGWMAGALAITGLVAWYVSGSYSIISFIFANQWVFIGLMIVKLLMVGSLAGWVNRMSVTTASTIFVLYAILTGVVFSALFLIYTAGSLASTFLITGGMFAIMSAYGWFTGNDLTKFGNMLFMLLIGLIIASIVNIFLNSTMLYWISTYVGVFIFTGLIAYDTQKIKNMGAQVTEGTDEYKKGAIVGALSLYLDFINLFLMLLRIFGGRK